MRKKWLVAAVIFSLIGIIVSSVSIAEYFHIQRSGLEEASFCSINEVINCDIVNASSYSVLFGIPTAVWGLLFYLVAAGFALFIRISKEPKESTLSFIWLVTIIGFIWTLRMAYVSAFVLHAICITCLSQYLVNLILLVSFSVAGTIGLKQRFLCIFSKKIFVSALVTGLVFGVGYVFALSAVKSSADNVTDENINEAVNAFFRQSLYDIKPETLAMAPVWGNPDAKVTIVEFSDFQCPFCKVAAFNVKPYLQEFRDKVKFVFLNYPLDNSCNKYMQGPMHTQSCIAARAAVCAQEKGRFWEYHDDVFRNQSKLSRDVLLNLASKNGIDKDWMGTCIDSKESLAKVEADIETGHHIYLAGTPSFFVDQRSLRVWRSPEALRKVIRQSLKNK